MSTTYVSHQGFDVFLPTSGKDTTMRAWFIAKNPHQSEVANLSRVWVHTVTLGVSYSPQITNLLRGCNV